MEEVPRTEKKKKAERIITLPFARELCDAGKQE
jgi:hypothetical protein